MSSISQTTVAEDAVLYPNRQQEAQAVEQLRQERQRYNHILAQEQRHRDETRAAASTKPSVLPKNYLSKPPAPEELQEKRRARKKSGSDADVSSDSLPLRSSDEAYSKKSTLALAPAFAKQSCRPRATDSPVVDRYHQAAGRPVPQSTMAQIDKWAEPAAFRAPVQLRAEQHNQRDSPSAYSQLSQSTYATDPLVNASRGREKLIKAIRN